jgi:hypothetical protein
LAENPKGTKSEQGSLGKANELNLVGGFNPSEKYESVGIIIPYISQYMEK